MTLPVNIDAQYPDRSPGDAAHQQHHDTIHAAVNEVNEGRLTAAQLSATYASVGTTAVNASAYGDDIQAAIDALPANGGRVILNKPSYTLTAGISTTKPSVELVGVGGGGQSPLLGNGVTQILVPAGVIGLTFGTAASANYAGVVLRNLHVRDAAPGAAEGGIKIVSQSNFILDNVIASGFSKATAVGILVDGTGALSQYGTMRDVQANNCKVGIKIDGAGGIRFFGGQLDGNDNQGSVVAGTTGVLVVGGGVHRFFGTVVQHYDTLMDLQAGADYTEFHGCRFEAFTTAGVKIASDNCKVWGGTINNSLGGGVGKGIDVLAGASNTLLMPNEIAAVATNVSNAGTNTQQWLNAGEVTLGSSGYLAVSSGVSLRADGANANFTGPGGNGVKFDRWIMTGNGEYGQGIYFGGIQDTYVSRTAANELGMAAGDSFKVDGTWNGGCLRLGAYNLWVDSTGRLRIKSGVPTSDTDGIVVGTQT